MLEAESPESQTDGVCYFDLLPVELLTKIFLNLTEGLSLLNWISTNDNFKVILQLVHLFQEGFTQLQMTQKYGTQF